MKGILGQKLGMTQVFLNNSTAIPVTIIQVHKNVVTEKFTMEKDNYVATQLATHDFQSSKIHSKKVSKPILGQFKKMKLAPMRFVKEIRGMNEYNKSQIIDASIFTPGEFVDVQAVSKGKGFAGAIKRHNQKIGPKSHGGGGGSKPQRLVGSIGTLRVSHVFKGMTMPGHTGNVKTTIQNLIVVHVDPREELLLVKGSIPGPKNAYVAIRHSIKKQNSKADIKLVNLQEAIEKNALLDEAKKYGADINTSMSVDEMNAAINAAKVASEAKKKADLVGKEVEVLQKTATELKEAAMKARNEASNAIDNEKAELIKKADELEKHAKDASEKAQKAIQEVEKATMVAEQKEKAAEELQVEPEIIEDENVDEPKDNQKNIDSKVGDSNE